MRVSAPIATFLSLIVSLAAAGLVSSGRAEAEPLLLYEPGSGKVLYAQDIDQLWHPASLTKIMTAYVVFNAIKDGRVTLKSKIPISEIAHKAQPSKIGLPVGSKISVDFALKALIIKSANDIAIALAEGVGQTYGDFIEEMNTTAKKLGMTRTRFVNPNGLPAVEQVTTARDLARLAKAVRRDYPQYSHYWATPSVRVGRRRLRSHNSLLRTLEGADGMKTGFICDSGFNIVASAERDGRNLIAIVLGATTSRKRSVRAANLLEHGFETYGWKLFFNTSSLDSVPASTKSMQVTSIRRTLPSRTCNPGLARRLRANRRAQRRRLRKLRKTHQRAVRRSKRAHKQKTAKGKASVSRPKNVTASGG